MGAATWRRRGSSLERAANAVAEIRTEQARKVEVRCFSPFEPFPSFVDALQALDSPKTTNDDDERRRRRAPFPIPLLAL